jgi:hypothetical protein
MCNGDNLDRGAFNAIEKPIWKNNKCGAAYAVALVNLGAGIGKNQNTLLNRR